VQCDVSHSVKQDEQGKEIARERGGKSGNGNQTEGAGKKRDGEGQEDEWK
jgi:hypothetical protein